MLRFTRWIAGPIGGIAVALGFDYGIWAWSDAVDGPNGKAWGILVVIVAAAAIAVATTANNGLGDAVVFGLAGATTVGLLFGEPTRVLAGDWWVADPLLQLGNTRMAPSVAGSLIAITVVTTRRYRTRTPSNDVPTTIGNSE